MKKILITLFALSFFLFPQTSQAAQDVSGFMNYQWETEFSVIHPEKDLQWLDESGGLGFHESKKDSNEDVTIIYIFKNNKLVSGAMYFHDLQSYYTGLGFLQKQLGPANMDTRNTSLHYWITDQTLINYRDGENRIVFSSLTFIRSQTKSRPPRSTD